MLLSMLPTGVLAADVAPPTVTNSVPAADAIGVAIDADITVAFDENVSESVYFSDIAITNGGTVVGYVYTLAGNTLTLNPDVNLAHGTVYTVTLPAEAVQDAAGNQSGAHSFSFTTAAPPVVEHTLTMAVYGEGTTIPTVGAHVYAPGTVVEITAAPADGWQFSHWVGAVANVNAAATTVTMDVAKTVTAHFTLVPPPQVVEHTLTMAVYGEGTTTPAVGDHVYAAGTVVEITATPADGWQFSHWVGAVADENAAATTVAMHASKEVTAHFTLVPLTGTITGTVTDGVYGVAGAIVEVVWQDIYGAWRSAGEAVTAADGSFRLMNIFPGAYDLLISPPQGELHLQFAEILGVNVYPGVTTALAPIELLIGGAITGTVTDGVYEVAGAIVEVVWRDIYGPWWYAGDVRTGADGSFTIPNMPPGSYDLRIFPPQGALYLMFTEVLGVTVVSGETAVLNQITLPLGGAITGKVTDIYGVGVGVAYVEVDWVGADGVAFWQNTWTDAQGNFTIAGIPPGSQVLQVFPPWGNPHLVRTRVPVIVTAGVTTVLAAPIALMLGGAISGTVTDGVYGVAGASVQVSTQDASGKWWGTSAQTEEDGSFIVTGILVTGIPSGTHRVWVIPPQGTNLIVSPNFNVTVTAGETTALQPIELIRGDILTGRVTGPDGNAAANIAVFVWDIYNAFAGFDWTDGTGTFAITLLPGRYYISLQSSPGGPYLAPHWVRDIEVTAGQITTVPDIGLKAGGRVAGRITNPAGVGVPNAHVRIIDKHGWWGFTTDGNGDFTTIALLPGTYAMEVIPPKGINLAQTRIPIIGISAEQTITQNTTLQRIIGTNPVITPTNANTQTITGTVYAAGATVTLTSATATFGTVTYPTATTWSVVVTLAAGTNTITATATDAAGNVGIATATIVFAPPAPAPGPGPAPAPTPTPPTVVEQPIVAGQPTEVKLEDVVTVTVTAGAITGDAPKISAQVMPAAAAAALIAEATGVGLTAASEVVVLTMTGGEFTAPVQLTLNFDAAKVATGQVPGVFVYNERTGRWIFLGGQVGVGTITVTVDRFSKFAVFATTPLPALADIVEHWGRGSIRTLAGMGIVSGFPDGKFNPNTGVTRAEFVSMLTRALGLTAKPEAAARFTDAAGWARGAIGAAAQAGLVAGYADGTFGGSRRITRAEMAVILQRVIRKDLVPVTFTAGADFADAGAFPAWAADGIRTAGTAGLVRGFQDRTFRPGSATTRAEAAAMLYRLVAER